MILGRPSPESALLRESVEGNKKNPDLTVFLMRHGETTADKSVEKRGFTERGEQEVRDNFDLILNQIIHDYNPDFDQLDDEQARKAELVKAIKNTVIHLRDGSTDRTKRQCWLQRKILKELGISEDAIDLPKPVYDWIEQNKPGEDVDQEVREEAGPGIGKRIDGAVNLDKVARVRRMIDDPQYQKGLGADGSLGAWRLTEDEHLEGVESFEHMDARLKKAVMKTQKLAGLIGKRRLQNKETKKHVVVANTHGFPITMLAAQELGIDLEKIGKVPTGQGVRVDFFGNDTKSVSPFGAEFSDKVEELES